MKGIRILSAQDVSCYGQCSLTVALPILSALGVETAILPTAILSTHTAGFTGFTFHDLQEELPKIKAHWEKEGIRFDAVYTGYLGSKKDVDIVIDIATSPLNKGPLIVDPAFGDHGKLYGGFDLDYVNEMKLLCAKSDVLLPNLTEAAFLLDRPFNPEPSEGEIEEILDGLTKLGAKSIVLKGIGSRPVDTGVIVKNGSLIQAYSHHKIPQDFHGTGDIFASVFVGARLRGLSDIASAQLAADFVSRAITNTLDDPKHFYGVKFEPLLVDLAEEVRELTE
ncbi:MAG: pyridoxamine kinase [Bacilli bacterium]|nr:pyridoxamine kinase [Bacilli bacterium]